MGRQVYAYGGAYAVNAVGKIRYTARTGAAFTSFSGWAETRVYTGTKTKNRLIFHNNGASPYVAYDGGGGMLGNVSYSVPSGGQRTHIEYQVKCMEAGCNPSGQMYKFDNMVIGVNDYTKPEVWVGGNLFYGGTISGVKTFDGLAVDSQSGIRTMSLYVNNTYHSTKYGNCTPARPDGTYLVMMPCKDTSLTWNTTVNTAAAPFKNGTNTVRICADDGSGEAACDSENVFVNN